MKFLTRYAFYALTLLGFGLLGGCSDKDEQTWADVIDDMFADDTTTQTYHSECHSYRDNKGVEHTECYSQHRSPRFSPAKRFGSTAMQEPQGSLVLANKFEMSYAASDTLIEAFYETKRSGK